MGLLSSQFQGDGIRVEKAWHQHTAHSDGGHHTELWGKLSHSGNPLNRCVVERERSNNILYVLNVYYI